MATELDGSTSSEMESLVSLEGCDPDLREYLERHRWPSVMEVPRSERLAVFSILQYKCISSGPPDRSDGNDTT